MRILELGTCAGISGSYIAAALAINRSGHLWTIEGSPALAAIAEETFAYLGLREYADVICGPFHQTLDHSLGNGPFGMAFIDGHHKGAATKRYYSDLKRHVLQKSVNRHLSSSGPSTDSSMLRRAEA